MKAWVYIVRCSDDSYYVGSTTDLDNRIADHNTGRFEGYTSIRLPVELLWMQEFVDIRDAVVFERQIKKWTRRKKEALMKGDFVLLHELARSTYSSDKKNNKPSFDSP
jgi:predicted GIY-YIG superfamily endonuclease